MGEELGGLSYMCAFSDGVEKAVAPVVLIAGATYQTSLPCGAQLSHCWGSLKRITFVLGGGKGSGVILKSKFPFMCAHAERHRLVWDVHRRLILRTAWGISKSHSWRGNSAWKVHNPAMK